MTAALILLPTHDHQDTLCESVEAVRRQTVGDWKLVAILDGSPPRTRQILEHFARIDRRISFVERSKGPRLGEAYRDEIIRSCAADAVLHATDDDLWFPNHLQTLLELLDAADFAHVALVQVTKTGAFAGHPASWGSARTRQATLDYRFNCTGPNQCGYRREAYLRLSTGWETTPSECPWTDGFMWGKFLRDPTVRRATRLTPTNLKLGAIGREHWEPGRRREELAKWVPRTVEPGFPDYLAARIEYSTYYRWSVGVCDALESDLESSLQMLGVEPVFGAAVNRLQASFDDEPAWLCLTREQFHDLEATWTYLSKRMPSQDIRPYLLRAIEIDPTDDAILQSLVARMIADGEGAAALRFAADIAEDTPLKGRRWNWIARRATELGCTEVAEQATRSAISARR